MDIHFTVNVRRPVVTGNLKFECNVQIYTPVLIWYIGCEIKNSCGNFVSLSKINAL